MRRIFLLISFVFLFGASDRRPAHAQTQTRAADEVVNVDRIVRAFTAKETE